MRRAALSLLIIVAACGQDPLPIERLNAAIDRAECTWRTRCGVEDSIETCLATRDGQSAFAYARTTPSIVAGVAADLITYDPVQAAECVDQIASLSCVAADESRRTQPSAICRGVLRADTKIASACLIDAECASRRCAQIRECDPATCCPGTCGEPIHYVRVGDDCSQYPCAPTGFCAGGVCVPLAPLGAACYGPGSCQFGLDCLDTCKAPPVEGDRCGALLGAPSCGTTLGLRCDLFTQTCRMPYLAVGAACELDDFDLCKRGECNPSTLQCQEIPRVGEPCRERCAPGAYCADVGDPQRVCLPKADDGSRGFGDDRHCRSGLRDVNDICVEAPVCL